MFFESLIIATVENLLNIFLYCSPVLKIARQKLYGKILRIVLKEFSAPLKIIFNEFQLNISGTWKGKADCLIITHVKLLTKLHNQNQLAMSICSGELKIKGDLQVIQNFIALINLAELNPTEILAPYIGDIAIEGISNLLHKISVLFHKNMQRQRHYISDLLTEEWRMMPSQLEMLWFIEEVAVANHAVKVFIKRLEKLGDK